MRWLIRTNLIVFLLIGILSFVSVEATVVGRVTRSLIELLAIFVFPGVNIVALAQHFFRKNFSPLEAIALSSATSLFIVPLFLALEFTSFGILFPRLLLINAFIVFIIVFGVFFFVSFVQKKKDGFPDFFFNFKSLQKYIVSKYFFLPLFLYASIALGIVTAFYPLPDLDPYYWYTEFQRSFSGGTLAGMTEHRPLFSALAYLFTYGAHVDFYAFFKYALPSFFLLLFFPLSLLASQYPNPLHRSIIFLFPFISGIGTIYLTLPIPQALANIAALFAVVFILYARTSRDPFFFFAGGGVFFLSYFYHEAMAIPLAIWIMSTLIAFHREILVLVKSNRLATAFFLIIILPYFDGPFSFIVSYGQKYFSTFLEFRTNILFPEHYVNIEGQQMGWGDLVGVGKYYLFYIGPVLMLVFATPLLLRKKFFTRKNFFSIYTTPLAIIFLVFFTIAEIFPRIASLAFLPDRAWVFGGIFGLFIVTLLFETRFGQRRLFLLLLLFGFTINIGAALYINYLKGYVITDRQLVSTEWVKHNLPQNSVIFSSGQKRLLQFYTNSEIVSVQDPNFYFDTETYKQEIEKYSPSKEGFLERYNKEVSNLESIVSAIQKRDPEKNASEILTLYNQSAISLESASKLFSGLQSSPREKPSVQFYVYYAAPDPRNPYIDRPYMKKFVNKESSIIFDKDPSHFKRIYSDKENHIFLWQIL